MLNFFRRSVAPKRSDDNDAKVWNDERAMAAEQEYGSDAEYLVWYARGVTAVAAALLGTTVYLAVQPIHNIQQLEHQVIAVPLACGQRLPAQMVTGRMMDIGETFQGEIEEFVTRLGKITGSARDYQSDRVWVNAHLYADTDVQAVKQFQALNPPRPLTDLQQEQYVDIRLSAPGVGGDDVWTVQFDTVVTAGPQEVRRKPWVMTARVLQAPAPQSAEARMSNPTGVYLTNIRVTAQNPHKQASAN